jgi:hypothetical protein
MSGDYYADIRRKYFLLNMKALGLIEELEAELSAEKKKKKKKRSGKTRRAVRALIGERDANG